MSSKHTGQNDVTQKLFVEAGTGIGHEKDGQRRCLGCMELYSEEYEICPYCGYTIAEEVENALHMFPGTVLYDKYIIGRVIGYGGFGVTYLAWDTVLQIKVAIKEYLPSEFSTRAAGQTQITVFSGDKTKQFNDGMEKFIDEAKRLAKFRSENGIVKIFDSFSENGTAYIAMEYLQGETLAERLEREKTIPIEESIQMLMPIIESLNKVHDEGIIHRDIAPDNIFLTNKGEVKLIDFGASRYATTSRSRSLTVIIKPGFSAEEQYRSRGDQGSHTDVYSVGAVLYKMITGQAPPDAMERRALFEKNGRDMLVPIKKFIKDIDPRRENAIYNALNIRIEDRTPDMISLAGELLSEEPVKKRRSGIKKIDPLTWPLWAKIGIPSGLVAAITLCVLFAFGIIGPKSTLDTRFVIPEGQAMVPDVVNGTVEDAKQKLNKESLNFSVAGKITSANIQRNYVLSQDPYASNVVNKGTIVEIIISDGFGMGFVDDMIGKSIELATQELKDAGFGVKVVEKPSDVWGAGTVIEQEYPEGTALEKETVIELVVSTGPEGLDRTKVVNVPNIVGMDYDAAIKYLEDFNLFISIDVVENNESIPDNQIIGQYPVAKTQVHQGDTIRVTVNRGKKTVYVPDVYDKQLDLAISELEAAGLNVSVKEEQNAEKSPGVVFRQSIEAGTKVTVGTSITVTVSSGMQVKVPDVTGKKLTEAQDILAKAGLTSDLVREPDDSVAKDRVITHDHIGDEVPRGTTITLVVSSGKVKTDSSDGSDSGDKDKKEEERVPALTNLKVKSLPEKREYYLGESLDTTGLKVVAVYSDDTEKDVTSQCNILEADLSKAGSVSVTVEFEDNGIEKKAGFTVKVIKPSISIDSSYSVEKGQAITLSAKTTPADAKVSWRVEDSDIAEVSGDKLKGLAHGNTRIVASISYSGGEVSTSAPVYVSGEIPVEELLLDKTVLSIRKDSKYTLKVTAKPSNATTTNYKWTSSNVSVASVENGVVEGIKPGKATITVTSSNGKKAQCEVTVEKVAVTSIKVTNEPDKTTYFCTEKVDLKGIEILVTYANGQTERIKDTSVLTYKHDTFGDKGSYPVTVTYEGASTTFDVTVQDARITIDKSVRTMSVGTTIQLKVTVEPASHTGTVSYISSDDNVATVDRSRGKVTAKKEGKVTITARTKYGPTDIEDSIVIEVKSTKPTSLEIRNEPSKDTYYVGETLDTSGMKVWVHYDGTTEKNLSISNFEVCFINSSGSKKSETLTDDLISGGQATVGVYFPGLSQVKTFKVTAKIPSIKLDKSNIRIDAGKTADINAPTVDIGDGSYSIKWESDNKGIATVYATNSNGRNAEIKGASQGTTTVRAILVYKGNEYPSGYCSVEVLGKKVTSITARKKSSKTVYMGDDIKAADFEVTVNYSDGSSESATSGVSCSPDKYGTSSRQTVTVSYGGKTANVSVNVSTPTITVSYRSRYITTSLGDSMKPTIEATPADGWDITYKSSDSSVVDVGSSNGTVTGLKAGGNAEITITAIYNGKYTVTTTWDIYVSAATATKFAGISKNPDKMAYQIGDELDISGMNVKIEYNNGTVDNKDSSGNIKAYFVGGSDILTPACVSGGKATIRVEYKGFDNTYDVRGITVNEPEISISPSGSTELEVGDEVTLKASMDNDDNLEWKWQMDGNNGYVTTSASGKELEITGKSAGTVEVWAVLTYKGTVVAQSDTYTITVA